PILHPPGGHILHGVRPNSRAGKFVARDFRALQFAAAAHSYYIVAGDQERINFDIFDPGLLRRQLAEARQQILDRWQAARCAFAENCQVEAALLQHPARQSCVEWRQTDGQITVNTRTSVARAEHQYRAELRINAGTKLCPMTATLGNAGAPKRWNPIVFEHL